MTPEIDVHQLAGVLDSGATVVDVREPGEYVDGHVPGNFLRAQGFDAYSVAAGTRGWANAGHPVVTGRTPGA